MSKKYELVEDDFVIRKGKKLYRIKALKKIDTARNAQVLKDSLGGYVEGYHNLSQEGGCWMYKNAKVYGNARVKDDAAVGVMSEIYGNASVEGDAMVGSDVRIYGNAVVKGYSDIANGSEIYGNAVIKDFAAVIGECWIYGNVSIKDHALVKRPAKIYDNVVVKDYAELLGHSELYVFGNTVVSTDDLL